MILNEQIKIIRKDPYFPSLLLEIPDPPAYLFALGNIPDPKKPHIAIVGTRSPSGYGKEMARHFAETLAQAGCVIVSGFARGIDTIAHQSAIEIGGQTIAVLGSGLNHIYPPENRLLRNKLTQNGAFFTEFPENMEPRPWNFPSRNRIIAGMSHLTLIVEAPVKSGALITAQYALDYNRPIFAIPGNLGQRGSEGTNGLIKEGAFPALAPENILEFLHLEPLLNNAVSLIKCTGDEKNILSFLTKEPMRVNTLVDALKLPAGKILGLLTILELKKMIYAENGTYRLKGLR